MTSVHPFSLAVAFFVAYLHTHSDSNYGISLSFTWVLPKKKPSAKPNKGPGPGRLSIVRPGAKHCDSTSV
jgi:hypothetical protein